MRYESPAGHARVPDTFHFSQHEKLTVDRALQEYVARLTGASGRRLAALLARIGWGDRPRLTLKEAGQAIGVTRERMRQIEDKLRKSAAQHPVTFPALERA